MNSFEQRKETIYNLICDKHYVPMKIKEMAVLLNIPRELRDELQAVLDALIAEGKIELSKRGKYSKAQAVKLQGTFMATQRGFGFVDVGDGEDIFISEKNCDTAMEGDKVEIVLIAGTGGQKREGKITAIIERSLVKVVGTYSDSGNYGFVIPDKSRINVDIFIPGQKSMKAVDGHKVVAKIVDYGGAGKNPEGEIIEIIGHVNDPGVDIMSIVRGYDLPYEFPEKVLNQAIRVSSPVSEADMNGRLDLRNVTTVTIDGEDAKDLDDAISIKETEKGYELGVHIADVTNYVQERSALDMEAINRGTSVYLADRVIPMLPHVLSNGICSLNAGEDRLALSCIMQIDRDGNIYDHQIAETVINVNKRMSYTAVSDVVDGTGFADEEYKAYQDMIMLMEKCALTLRKKRQQRGSIDFDLPETKLIIDEKGTPVEVKPYDRNEASRIIEDFMLAANETVACDYYWQSSPFLYRVHEEPEEDKIKKLARFVGSFGYSLHTSSGSIFPKELQKMLVKVEGKPEETLISRITLRSLRQARYSVECGGHFGLAATYYCHFTSPIRRYPDLQIHRIIKDSLRGRMTIARTEHYDSILPGIANSTSKCERRAKETEREVLKMKKAEYMENHIGEVYDGVVSGVTKYGIYVELPNTVEGMISVHSLRDEFIFDEEKYELRGQYTGISFGLGQPIRVEITGADKIMRTVDMKLVQE